MGDEDNGPTYRVEYLDGDREGRDGSLAWVARAGRARVTYPNGDVYEGDFNAMRQRHGSGVYTYAGAGGGEDGEEEDAGGEDGGAGGAGGIKAQYSGDFRLGKRTGTGKMRYPDGGVYTGAWKDGLRSGSGSYRYPNGDVFTGRFKDNKKVGRGAYTYAKNGSKLVGTWTDDVFTTGKWVMPDNTSYHGSWQGSVPRGNGTFYFANGNTLEGKFEGKGAGDGEEEDAGGEDGAGAAPGVWVPEARTLSRAVGISPADLVNYAERDPDEIAEIRAEAAAIEAAAAAAVAAAEAAAVGPAEAEAEAAAPAEAEEGKAEEGKDE